MGQMHELHGKVALVTGGGEDVGRAIALALAARGVRVVITGREERALGETVQIRLKHPRSGQRNFRGRLTAADDASLHLVLDDGAELELPRGEVSRSNIVWKPVTL